MKKLFSIILMLCFSSGLWASQPDLGSLAQEMIGPVVIFSNFVATASLVIGISFLFASFLRYLQFRVNPLASPLSTVFALLIMGIVLVCIPVMYRLSETGVPKTVDVHANQ